MLGTNSAIHVAGIYSRNWESNYSQISELHSKTVQLVNQVEKDESLGNRDIED